MDLGIQPSGSSKPVGKGLKRKRGDRLDRKEILLKKLNVVADAQADRMKQITNLFDEYKQKQAEVKEKQAEEKEKRAERHTEIVNMGRDFLKQMAEMNAAIRAASQKE
jgi:hypothetical protein